MTHAVYNRINDLMGKYCKRHAEERLKDLQATEDRRVITARREGHL
jgi:hypothetical protein